MAYMNHRNLASVSLIVYCLAVCFEQTVEKNHPDVVSPSDLKLIRERWNVKNIIRDINHIKEDIKKISSMQEAGTISNEEALFYFIRMHDFDNNDKLDGLEILIAVNHAIEPNSNEYESIYFEEKEKYVDHLLKFDRNLDGFLSYEELKEFNKGYTERDSEF